MRKAYGLIYALVILLGIAYIGRASLRQEGLWIDWISNSHLKFQSRLYVQSIAEMAALCLKYYGFELCKSDKMIWGDYHKGGYDLSIDKNGYCWADVYVESQNLRTSQILRTTAKILLKEKNGN
ncbi:hypothetical protein [Helicobacter sp. 11S03491-1]|uniref:hypothetical protein n=1 Tax=Helicobacter sp. 11S03491-1 TaxID=1476196 RepID=UPI000BA54872|nr:hypothetical protein [Helicobacter sp. 11S03491-1]PAF42936.1 hypothetical protein BKH45_02390 [Helicobacter sp. 11S03491-1]